MISILYHHHSNSVTIPRQSDDTEDRTKVAWILHAIAYAIAFMQLHAIEVCHLTLRFHAIACNQYAIAYATV